MYKVYHKTHHYLRSDTVGDYVSLLLALCGLTVSTQYRDTDSTKTPFKCPVKEIVPAVEKPFVLIEGANEPTGSKLVI